MYKSSDGSILYHRDHHPIELSPVLVSGFFSAIQSFGREITGDQKSEIKEIDMDKYWITFRTDASTDVTVVLVADRDDKVWASSALSQLVHFVKETLSELPDVTHLYVPLESLKGFNEEVENIIKKAEDEILVEKKKIIPILKKEKDKLKVSSDESKIVSIVNGERSLQKITNLLKMPYFKVMSVCVSLKKKCIDTIMRRIILDKILPVITGLLVIPAFPQIRERMFEWDLLGDGTKEAVGSWYGNHWHTILLWTYIAVFALPSCIYMVILRFVQKPELLNIFVGFCTSILTGFAIVIFIHFQWPLVTKPRIFAITMPSKEEGGTYVIDDSRMSKKVEVPTGDNFLIFIRITNLGVNTYKNSGVIVDFQHIAKVVPYSDDLYEKIPWKKKFIRSKPNYIFFSPKENYQTIAPRCHLVLPVWIKAESAQKGEISILFHCETRNGETGEELELVVK